MQARRSGRATKGSVEPSVDAHQEQLLVALEAELTETGEWLARLEARLDEIERRLAEPRAAASDSSRANPEVAAAPHGDPVNRVVQIAAGPWSESAEWSYLLRRCEGFRVCDSSGLLGVVESVRFGHDLELPETLVVDAGGRGRRRRVSIGVSEVADVDLEQREVRLAVPARAWLFPGSAHRRLRRWMRLPSGAPNH